MLINIHIYNTNVIKGHKQEYKTFKKSDGTENKYLDGIVFVHRLKFRVFDVLMLKYGNRNPFKMHRD